MTNPELEPWQRNVLLASLMSWFVGRLDDEQFVRVTANTLAPAPKRGKCCSRCGRGGHNATTCGNMSHG